MLDKIPDDSEMTALVGQKLYYIWQELCAAIDEKYDMDTLWGAGGKKWVYEYKYRRGGKTLCALYAKKDCIGFMVIFGKDERERFEASAGDYSPAVRQTYELAHTYHDGKWVMFEPADTSVLGDYIRLLGIKRKPNRK